MAETLFNILHTTSNNITSVVVIGNKMYISTANELNVVDITTNVVIDVYTTTISGRAREALSSTGITDISVGV